MSPGQPGLSCNAANRLQAKFTGEQHDSLSLSPTSVSYNSTILIELTNIINGVIHLELFISILDKPTHTKNYSSGHL